LANHKSALKRLKQARKQTALNRMHRTRLRHQIRKFREALSGKDQAEAQALLAPTLSLIDHSVHRGVLHANTAARYKSRLTLRLEKVAKGSAARA
jgi:small subunit ribosomal protein S20